MSAEIAGDVCVVVPARDGERYLGEALESVLSGTVHPAEVVVVDDGSTDATAAIAERFGAPVRVVGQRRSGLATALNRGIEETTGRLVTFIDADDRWTPERLEIGLRALASQPDLDGVIGRSVEFASPDLEPAERRRLVVRTEPGPGWLRGALLIRRGFHDRIGPYDETLRVGEFVDWCARARDAGARIETLDDVVLRRRIHGSNMTRRDSQERLDYVRIARDALRRREGRPG